MSDIEYSLYNDLYMNGYSTYHNPDMFYYLNFYFKIPKIRYRDGSKYPLLKLNFLLDKTQKLVAKTYLGGLNYTYGKCDAWEGIGSNTTDWHNDIIEGNNLAVLMYLSDLSEDSGGGLSIRRNKEKSHVTIWPKKYDMIFMLQEDSWEHKVEIMKKKTQRKVGHLEFNIE